MVHIPQFEKQKIKIMYTILHNKPTRVVESSTSYMDKQKLSDYVI